MKKSFLILTVLTSLTLIPRESHAIIIGGSVTGGTAKTAGGTFIKLTPPLANPHGAANSVGNDTFQAPNLYGFDEDQNVFVGPGNLNVDLIAGGGSGTILAGTEVASHYIFFDPTSQSQIGYVDFDADILAVITSTGRLAASDYLANTGVNYLNPSARGLEAGDSATIDATYAYRLDVNWVASTPGDYVRVLTRHSPGAATPDGGATITLMLCGMALLGGLHRRLG